MAPKTDTNTLSVAETLARWAAGVERADIPDGVVRMARLVLLDQVGLSVAARREPYVTAILGSVLAEGKVTAFGHGARFNAYDAALINGTAAHGEDYDDTFEGTPMHTGVVAISSVLAAAEQFGLSGADFLRGVTVVTEVMCRMAIVAPTGIHRAGFHPTAVAGALGAAAGVATALRLPPDRIVSAIGIAGSFASGIIEYLAEGSSTKRMHPGWAAQAGIRAALMAKGGFDGPRTVFEGEHGFYFAFNVRQITPDFTRLTEGLGRDWHASRIAFKPYACGTMVQPFIDCAIALSKDGVRPEEIESITCQVGEGTVHRLWEPLAEKRAPSTAYSAKFSVPYGVAIGIVDQAAGLSQFTEERIRDPRVLDLAKRVSYEINPNDEYPRNYTGQVTVRLKDGRVIERFQPHLRGGVREPLSEAELEAKFLANCRFGGLEEASIAALRDWISQAFEQERVVVPA